MSDVPEAVVTSRQISKDEETMPASARLVPELVHSYLSQAGEDISALSQTQPILLVFLRHFGCTFCREAVCEIEKIRPNIESLGTHLAFVHLSSEDRAQKFFAPHHFEDVPRFADPDGRLYEAFGLVRAKWHQYLNPRSIGRFFSAWSRGHMVGAPDGDIERMPGVFLIHRAEILKSFRHKLVSDRPDYLSLASPR
ncbi:MAG TPA: SelL-related redox protein [Candidatus Dormibacteraeota bacterium]|nr:SelL-related redox protein [Candidatus Dormibacteraeota bacterium]